MNVTNNPLFSCRTDEKNPYIDILKFKDTKDEVDRRTQMTVLFNYICNAFYTKSYVYIYPNGKCSNFYIDILKDVEKYPQNFHNTKQEVEWAFKVFFGVLENISRLYQKDRTIKMEMLDYDIVILNDIYYENVLNLVINKIYFVDGVVRAAKCLEKFV